jgi:hypothetical protein
MGVEVVVDMAQFFIHVLVFRPIDGQIPCGFADSDGNIHALYLQNALKALSISTEQETQVLRKLGGDHMNCTAMATILAGLLERYWPMILANNEKLFLK